MTLCFNLVFLSLLQPVLLNKYVPQFCRMPFYKLHEESLYIEMQLNGLLVGEMQYWEPNLRNRTNLHLLHIKWKLHP